MDKDRQRQLNREAQARWYARNKEKKHSQNANWRLLNPDKVQAYRKGTLRQSEKQELSDSN
jgi:hypothetical protein